MGKFKKSVIIILAILFALYVGSWIKYVVFDHPRQLKKAESASTKSIKPTMNIEEIITLPTKEGNAADNYVRGITSLEEAHKKAHKRTDFFKNFERKEIQEAVLEMEKGAEKRGCSFAPKYYPVMTTLYDNLPNLYITRRLIKALTAKGNSYAEEGNLEKAVTCYEKAIIFGRHLTDESRRSGALISFMNGILIQKEGFKALKDFYIKNKQQNKADKCSKYLNELEKVPNKVNKKVDNIKIDLKPFYNADNVEAAIKTAFYDEDYFWRQEAMLCLCASYMAKWKWFESRAAKKALIKLTKDPSPYIRKTANFYLNPIMPGLKSVVYIPLLGVNFGSNKLQKIINWFYEALTKKPAESNPINIPNVIQKFIDGFRKRTFSKKPAIEELKEIRNALELFYKKHKRYPLIEEGIAKLVTKGFLDTDAFLDPWERPYNYEPIKKAQDYRLSSSGRDGIRRTKDDIQSPVGNHAFPK